MVAYGFKKVFSAQISTGLKTHTIRGNRKRHARPGEQLQLFEAMRTRYCRKIIADPTCTFVDPIFISVESDGIVAIEIPGLWISAEPATIEWFARLDGFAPEHINGLALDMSGKTARENMSQFWLANHALGRFEGVIVGWGERPLHPPVI